MRYDVDFATNARIVAAGELAQIVDVAAPFAPAHSDFELPRWMWLSMLCGYATFFGGLIAATAEEARTAFAIVIALFYTLMFFGTARILVHVDQRRVGAFTSTGGELQTWTGPMAVGAVAGQVLTMPFVLGFFGVAIAVISAIVM